VPSASNRSPAASRAAADAGGHGEPPPPAPAQPGQPERLIAALGDDLLGRLDLEGALADENWRSAVVRLAADLRATLLAHPGAVPLLLHAGFAGPRALVAGEALLELLSRGGLAADDAARASYLLQTYVLGTVALDAAELPPGVSRPDDAARAAERRRALDGDAQFRWGLDRLLDGL
jgi:TetR/AcrR family tetracycline transcriptional repressor